MLWFKLAKSIASAGAYDVLRLACGMAWTITKAPFVKRGMTWRRKMRKCLRCPVYDPDLKQCWFVNPGDGKRYGCRCFMPFKALVSQHGWGYYNMEPPDNDTVCW